MKITMPNFRPTKKSRPQKLDAAARRAPAPTHDDFDEEPTMRLSSALIVVFILHLIAAGGLWAFSNFKEKNSSAEVERDVRERLQNAAPAVPSTTTSKPAVTSMNPSTKPATETTTVKDSGETYTVLKGDNPVTIAKRFGVKYDDLLKLNRIDDARHMQIGIKLHLPAKAHHAKPE